MGLSAVPTEVLRQLMHGVLLLQVNMCRMGWGPDSSSPNLPSARPVHLLRDRGQGGPTGCGKAHSVPSSPAGSREQKASRGDIPHVEGEEDGRACGKAVHVTV